MIIYIYIKEILIFPLLTKVIQVPEWLPISTDGISCHYD